MKVKLSIIPKTRMIRSWKLDTRIKIDAVIKELVDNPFDAFANTVTIHKSVSGITIYDDGQGIQDIREALSFGASDDESAHKRLGRHGIALKKGPARIARFLNITTQSKNKLVKLELDWVGLERSDEWSIEPDIKPRLKTDKASTFTEIEMTGIYPFRISGWKDLPAKLSTTFAPGLRDGKQIFFDGVPLTAPPKPILEDVIETAGEIPNGGGRGFIIQAGLLSENESGSLGIQIEYLHRVITEAWTPKFLFRCSLRRFAAYVTLIDGDTEKWELNNFKDDIDEEQQAELEAALEPILKPLVERLKDEAHNLKIKTLETKFAQMIFGQGNEPYLHKNTDGDRIILPPIGKKGRRQKRRRKQFSEKVGQRDEINGTKATIRGERSFAFAFEDIPQKRELIEIRAYGGESLKLVINTAHKFGAELKEQFDRNEHGAIMATGLWALAGYMTSKDDYQKTYRFMLNGQDSVFDATNLNVSRWLEYGAASV